LSLSSQGYEIPPPSYDESFADLPPDYTVTDALAIAHAPEYTPFTSHDDSLCSGVSKRLRIGNSSLFSSSFFFDEKSLYADIDFGYCETGIKSHAKKKAKPAAKKPAAASTPPEEKKEEEAAGGGDGGGGDPPADGGAGGGDGGDGGDDGGKKGKKKTKKEKEEEERLKKEEEERLQKEEDERLQREEEERAQKEEEERLAKEAEEEAERKKKEEEDAAAAAAAKPMKITSALADLSWANPNETTDDWAAFGAAAPGKKKKGKKGKVRDSVYLITSCSTLTLP
jgi:hypothetical protein